MSPQHYTKLTVEASIFCSKCMKETRWRVADGRRQWCIACYERDHRPNQETQPVEREKAAEQIELFSRHKEKA